MKQLATKFSDSYITGTWHENFIIKMPSLILALPTSQKCFYKKLLSVTFFKYRFIFVDLTKLREQIYTNFNKRIYKKGVVFAVAFFQHLFQSDNLAV